MKQSQFALNLVKVIPLIDFVIMRDKFNPCAEIVTAFGLVTQRLSGPSVNWTDGKDIWTDNINSPLFRYPRDRNEVIDLITPELLKFIVENYDTLPYTWPGQNNFNIQLQKLIDDITII